jgi:hypothetical protein
MYESAHSCPVARTPQQQQTGCRVPPSKTYTQCAMDAAPITHRGGGYRATATASATRKTATPRALPVMVQRQWWWRTCGADDDGKARHGSCD